MSRRQLAPFALASLGICLLILWQVLEIRAMSDAAVERHQRYAEACLQAVEGVALAECRGGRYAPQQLELTFAELRANFALGHIALWELGPDGQKILVESGQDPGKLPHSHFRTAFEPLRPRWPGRGRPFGGGGGNSPLRELPASPLAIEIVLPLEELNSQLSDLRRRGILISLVLGGTMLLIALFMQARLRSLELRAELASSEVRVQGLEYLKRLGAGLVHETKNPLGVVRGFAERIAHDSDAGKDLRRNAQAILEETDRTVARLDEFLLLSRPAALKRERVDLAALFAELELLIGPDLEAQHADLRLETEVGSLSADREQLRRMLLNLLLNAIAAIEEGGRITLRSESSSTGTGLRIVVQDDGCGVPDSLRDSLFEPYVTGREGGTGLGLAICRRIAIDHGFTLDFEDAPGGGTRMVITVPEEHA